MRGSRLSDLTAQIEKCNSEKFASERGVGVFVVLGESVSNVPGRSRLKDS